MAERQAERRDGDGTTALRGKRAAKPCARQHLGGRPVVEVAEKAAPGVGGAVRIDQQLDEYRDHESGQHSDKDWSHGLHRAGRLSTRQGLTKHCP